MRLPGRTRARPSTNSWRVGHRPSCKSGSRAAALHVKRAQNDFRLLHSNRGGRIAVDDTAFEQSHLAPDILQVVGRNGVEVAIPNGDVCVLPNLEGANAILEEELMRRPNGIRAEGGVDVHSLRGAERLIAVRAVESLANDSAPNPVTCRKRGDKIV